MAEETILEWKPINDRFLKAALNSKFVEMTVIVCYALTEDAQEEIKDEFYDQLEDSDKVPAGKEKTMVRVVMMYISTIMAKDLLSYVKRPT